MDFQTVNKITRFLMSVCVLHNICIDANDILPFGDEEMNEEEAPEQDGPLPLDMNARQIKLRGESKRDRLVAFLSGR